jgi:hypothetical protein
MIGALTPPLGARPNLGRSTPANGATLGACGHRNEARGNHIADTSVNHIAEGSEAADCTPMHPIAEIRELLAPHGELRPQGRECWHGTIPLPEIVAEFYEKIGPWGPTIHETVGPIGSTIPTGGNPTCIPPLHRLWNYQVGYRWHASTGERLTDWLDDWLVVAQEGAHPYILQISTGRILFAFAGAGKWAPKEVFPDIFTMAAALATIGNVYDEVGEARWDEELNETPEFVALKVQRLAQVLGDRGAAERYFKTIA